MNSDARDIDRLLPQTQCTRCGYAGCRPYAEAIAAGEAPINRCPPGGDATIAALAELLDRERLPLDPECGVQKDQVALIDEATCIGCTRCIQACPVDAIVGAAKLMHTVIAAECTGCELCLSPCPVDCIELHPVAPGANPPANAADTAPTRVEVLRARHLPAVARATADRTRRRFDARNDRLERERAARDERRHAKRDASPADAADRRRDEIQAMVAAVRARRNRETDRP